MVLSAGRRVELVAGFLDARDRLSPDSIVIAADVNPHQSSACHTADQSLQVPFASDSEYTSVMLDIFEKYGIGLVIPTIDPELLVLSNLRVRAEKNGTHVIISEPVLIEHCRDKRKTAHLFKDVGISSPEVYALDKIQFPCFSKPADGSSSIGAFRIEAADDVTEDLLADPQRMFMELVPAGQREFTIDLYYDRHSNLQAAIPRERIEVRSGEVSKGITRRDWVYDYLLDKMPHMKGARGCLTLQLFADDRTQKVSAIEINPRFGGGFPLSLAAGADFPAWLIEEYQLGRAIDFYDRWAGNLLMLRYDAKILVPSHD
jgi:carbamoyl-phosphate synthase large subunit